LCKAQIPPNPAPMTMASKSVLALLVTNELLGVLGNFLRTCPMVGVARAGSRQVFRGCFVFVADTLWRISADTREYLVVLNDEEQYSI